MTTTKERMYILRKRYEMKKYGISVEIYDEMLLKQSGVCAICGRKEDNGNALSVDHDHKTGKVRGLLCHKCNSIISFSEESEEILFFQKIIDYIKLYK